MLDQMIDERLDYTESMINLSWDAWFASGNEPAFERTIQEATDLLAFTGEARDTVGKEFVPFEIYEIRGKASRDLGKPIDAQSRSSYSTLACLARYQQRSGT